MFQPFTTDNTPEGLKRARNAMRQRLWADDAFAHRWLCHHHDNTDCQDGCDKRAHPERAALYQSEIE